MLMLQLLFVFLLFLLISVLALVIRVLRNLGKKGVDTKLCEAGRRLPHGEDDGFAGWLWWSQYGNEKDSIQVSEIFCDCFE